MDPSCYPETWKTQRLLVPFKKKIIDTTVMSKSSVGVQKMSALTALVDAGSCSYLVHLTVVHLFVTVHSQVIHPAATSDVEAWNCMWMCVYACVYMCVREIVSYVAG